MCNNRKRPRKVYTLKYKTRLEAFYYEGVLYISTVQRKILLSCVSLPDRTFLSNLNKIFLFRQHKFIEIDYFKVTSTTIVQSTTTWTTTAGGKKKSFMEEFITLSSFIVSSKHVLLIHVLNI